MRNGTGRNNIVYGGNNTTSGNYLRRTSTGRNDISFININNTSTTINALERISTGINDIRWNNLTFSFFSRNFCFILSFVFENLGCNNEN